MQDAAAGRGDIFALSGFDHFDDLESFGTGISPDPAGREDCSGMRDFAAGFRGYTGCYAGNDDGWGAD